MPLQTTLDFIHQTTWDEIPSDGRHIAARSLLDLTGTLIAGRRTDLSRIVCEFAVKIFAGDQATLLLDGRRSEVAGAALAMGMTIDSIDAHDGSRLAKGHAGAGIFPIAVSAGERNGWSGTEFLTALIIGYEISLRAAQALHATAKDYHSSGSWVAIGAAAVAARAKGLDHEATRHALGIAEYHGPRSEMMRCIDHPTMLKDGSGWGSMTGVMAADLAEAGFTGAPAITLEGESLRAIWDDLGAEWRIRDLYFKPYPCCRWAQPAIDGALQLARANALKGVEIKNIEVFTFEEAARLVIRHPANTEQAQYSLPYPLAAAVLNQGLNPVHVQEAFLNNPDILSLADKVTLHVDPELDEKFPAQTLARVRMTTSDGRVLETATVDASGGSGNPISDDQLTRKFENAAAGSMNEDRSHAIQRACWECAELESIQDLISLLTDPI